METEPTPNPHCRRRHFRVDVTAPELTLCQNIRSGFFVQQCRVLQECELRINDRRQRLVRDLDPVQRVLRQRPAFGNNGDHRLAHIAHLAARQRVYRCRMVVSHAGGGANWRN